MIDISFISQEQTLFEGQAKMVVMDGKEGQLGVVKGHSPLLAILKPGPVRMITDDNEEVFFTNGGFAEVQPCLLYTSPSPRDVSRSRMPSSA